jgi:hypothetical protein
MQQSVISQLHNIDLVHGCLQQHLLLNKLHEGRLQQNKPAGME